MIWTSRTVFINCKNKKYYKTILKKARCIQNSLHAEDSKFAKIIKIS